MKNRLYGIEKIKVKDEEVNISSKERTLIDLIYFNKPVGGIINASKVFIKIVNDDKCDLKKLVKYAVCFPNIKTRKQIGLLLDEAGVPENILKPLLKSLKKTSISSLNGSRKGTLNKKWRVIVNDSRK